MTMNPTVSVPEDDLSSGQLVLSPDPVLRDALSRAAEELDMALEDLAIEILGGWLGQQGDFPVDPIPPEPSAEIPPEGSSICQECDRVFTPEDSADPVDSLRRHGAATGHTTGIEGAD